MRRILGVLFGVLVCPAWLWAQPTFNATTSCGGTAVASLTCNDVSVASGTNRVMVIGITQNWCGDAPNSQPTAVSYGLQSATLAHRRCSGTSLMGTDHWLLIHPTTGLAPLEVTLSNQAHTVFLGHQTWNGVEQTSPVRATGDSTGFGNAASTTVTSVAGDLVVGLAGGFDAPLTPAQTSRWSRNIGTVYGSASSTSATTTSTGLSWSRTGDGYWVAQGLSLIPSTAARRRLWVVSP